MSDAQTNTGVTSATNEPLELTAKIADICLGNEEAAAFCTAFFYWVHWIDDLVDKDKFYQVAEVTRINLEAMVAFSENAFFQRHQDALLSLIVAAFGAFQDSNEFQLRFDYRDRRAADILKSYYHEVFWQVAFIVGGWKHRTAMTAKYREFDYEEIGDHEFDSQSDNRPSNSPSHRERNQSGTTLGGGTSPK